MSATSKAARRERAWDAAIYGKVATGAVLALAAPVVVVIAERARIWRNARRWAR